MPGQILKFLVVLRLSIKQEVFRNGKEACARNCARRRVSERNRRKAVALGA